MTNPNSSTQATETALTVREVGEYLRANRIPAMAFWQHVAGGDMIPMTLTDVRRFAAEVSP